MFDEPNGEGVEPKIEGVGAVFPKIDPNLDLESAESLANKFELVKDCGCGLEKQLFATAGIFKKLPPAVSEVADLSAESAKFDSFGESLDGRPNEKSTFGVESDLGELIGKVGGFGESLEGRPNENSTFLFDSDLGELIGLDIFGVASGAFWMDGDET